MDTHGLTFVESTIHSDHAAWLAVAKRVALRMHDNSISADLMRSVSWFMAIQFWFNDIATYCSEALERVGVEFMLSPLVCNEFVYHCASVH
jgi:hypothetical protein